MSDDINRLPYVLGVAGLYHDSAAALVHGPEIVAAVEEERLSRKKHDARLPVEAMKYCLSLIPAGEALDAVVFYENEALALDRVIKNALAVAPSGMEHWRQAARSMLGSKVYVGSRIREIVGPAVPLLSADHHMSHAASAFYPSPFDSAAIVVVDGVGEWATTSLGIGTGRGIELLSEMRYPHSLGLLYSAFSYYCGFRVNSGEYKLMGLAPYGTPRFAKLIREKLIDVRSDGSFSLDTDYFGYLDGPMMTNAKFDQLFGGPALPFDSTITQKEMDLAASVQAVLEDVMLKLAKHARRVTGEKNLCMAGGVALNCVANGKIAEAGSFEHVWIQPASSDAGGALGAAFLGAHAHFGVERGPRSRAGDRQRGSFLGPSFSQQEAEGALQSAGLTYRRVPEGDERRRAVASALAEGSIVGFFTGAMEFGPRALGARSILADPRNPQTQTSLNLKVKFRESWRPFAAAVLAEDRREYFDMRDENAYMLLVTHVRRSRRRTARGSQSTNLMERLGQARSDIPAVTHVDYSTRVQTVREEENPELYELLVQFKELTGYGMLVNTSFNVRGEPIVCTPTEAIDCFLSTDIDMLVLEDCLVSKADVDLSAHKRESRYALD